MQSYFWGESEVPELKLKWTYFIILEHSLVCQVLAYKHEDLSSISRIQVAKLDALAEYSVTLLRK